MDTLPSLEATGPIELVGTGRFELPTPRTPSGLCAQLGRRRGIKGLGSELPLAQAKASCQRTQANSRGVFRVQISLSEREFSVHDSYPTWAFWPYIEENLLARKRLLQSLQN
jgi:hypothetical protein